MSVGRQFGERSEQCATGSHFHHNWSVYVRTIRRLGFQWGYQLPLAHLLADRVYIAFIRNDTKWKFVASHTLQYYTITIQYNTIQYGIVPAMNGGATDIGTVTKFIIWANWSSTHQFSSTHCAYRLLHTHCYYNAILYMHTMDIAIKCNVLPPSPSPTNWWPGCYLWLDDHGDDNNIIDDQEDDDGDDQLRACVT